MVKSQFLSNPEILTSLQELNNHISVPLWLFGGVAVDFLAGRWTRPHGDIDLNTFTEFRDDLTRELHQIGYHTSDSGWLTHWNQDGNNRYLEIVFLERSLDGAAVLHIDDDDCIGVPGYFHTVPDYLDINRFAILDGVRFRVCSPAGEWLARASQLEVISGRVREPKLEHDLQLLESLLTEIELVHLRSIVTRQ